MGNKMLIDATHPEETRVVVLRGNRVEEFDFESAARKQLRGNIYLAKVTRVEPSLQAAFVNYGGNRHGFLAFNEIHPDYYQLPMAERQALKAEEARARKRAFADDGDEETETASTDNNADADEHSDGLEEAANEDRNAAAHDAEEGDDDADSPEDVALALTAALPAAKYSTDLYDETADSSENGVETLNAGDSHEVLADAHDESDSHENGDRDEGHENDNDNEHGNGDEHDTHHEERHHHVESVGSEDALEELPERSRRRRRTYKIQEVIKRGQIILVQVVKEERGNKGAALTTYLSLAGRYTVLMPNTASGGGISRKISSPGDRKRLREIAGELDVSEGMGLIIRTAGAARTKTEIKRDYEYLLRLWENVRDLTLKSSAPALVYEEGDLIKRSIRDLYNREIDEVLVAGDDAYRDAKDFMRMLMPSHAKNVQPYKDPEPLFTRYEVERQLNAMFSPQVTLPSGGYIVLNQTEALVAIDVNSGKATREFSIEDTALKTNLEASDEIARQLRLRDLAGLIVVDFIDMEEKRNNRAVERRMKECLRNDRARIQVGHISHFGLLEMSRQRLRTGMVEGSTTQCPHCQGTGVIRSTESVALSVLRSLEDWLRTNSPFDLNAVTSVEVALYILNQKRGYLHDIEKRYDVILTVTASERMQGSNFYIEKLAPATPTAGINNAVTQSDRIIQPFEEAAETTEDDENAQRSRRKRRRRRGRDRLDSREHARDDDNDDDRTEPGEDDAPTSDEEAASLMDAEGQPQQRAAENRTDEDGQPRRRSRRRGRRGGRHQRVRVREASESSDTEQPHLDDASVGAWGHFHEAAETSEPRETTTAQPFEAVVVRGETVQPVEVRKETVDFHHHRGRSQSERSQSNGVHHSEIAELTKEHSGARPESSEEAPAEVAHKPRGTRRGWWQHRVNR
jgi:ribonuclease E